MKNIKFFCLLAAFLSINSLFGQSKTDTVTVSGVCGMCKNRIERAAFGVRGIEKVTWTAISQSLVVTYNSKKTNAAAIQMRVAAAGHDTQKFKASDKAYKTLPGCCRYRDGVEIHED